MERFEEIMSLNGSITKVLFWVSTLLFVIFFTAKIASDNFILSILHTIAVISIITKIIIELIMVVKNKNNGLIFGALFSLIISTTIALEIFITIPIEYANNYTFSALFIVFLLMLYSLFIIGFTKIKTAHAAQVSFLDLRLKRFEYKEGPAWWFPKNLGGDLTEFYIENKAIELYQDGEAISTSHGMRFKKSPITLVYKYNDLYKIITSGKDLEEELRKIILNRVVSAIPLIESSITEEELNKKYSGLSLLFLKNSTELLKKVINNGAFYESHHLFKELLDDELYINSICEAFDKEHPNNSVSKDEKLAWFTVKKSKELNIPVFTESQWKTVLQTKPEFELPKVGIYWEAYQQGIECIKLTFKSFELEDDISKEINSRRVEIIQKEKEKENAKTLSAITNSIVNDTNGKVSHEKALQAALLAMNTPNYEVKVYEIVGDSQADKVIAAISGVMKGEK